MYPRFEIREKTIHIPGSGYSDDSSTRTQYRLWLVLEAAHERHIDSSWYRNEMFNLADLIKRAAINGPEPEATT